jgi:tetratricopeptide (TPR) repeat protein
MKARPRELRTPTRRTQRRWRVPPALLHGPEALEGAGVLQEIAGEAGLLLWQALRDVTLWAQALPSERGELFSEAAEQRRVAALLVADVEAGIEEPLGVLTEIVGRPTRVRAEKVALACQQISQWAEVNGSLATALAFAQAAALACPGDAIAGLKVGQLARRHGEHARSETWFRRTIALARQSGDWASYALAFLGLGVLYNQRGNLPAARKFLIRSWRAASRHSLHNIAGGASHDLHVVATAAGRPAEALKYARRAFDHYGRNNPRLPHLAHDVAYFWMTEGAFERAFAVFEAVLPTIQVPAEQVAVLSNIARAAGGAGKEEAFRRAWERVWDCFEHDGCHEASAEGLLELSHGAVSMGDWDRAERAAQLAHEVARERREGRIQLAAESLLDAVHGYRAAEAAVPMALAPETDAEADAFADELVHSLNEYAVAS